MVLKLLKNAVSVCLNSYNALKILRVFNKIKFKMFNCSFAASIFRLVVLRFIYTHNLDLVISLSDVISIEILPSFQIATAGDSNIV